MSMMMMQSVALGSATTGSFASGTRLGSRRTPAAGRLGPRTNCVVAAVKAPKGVTQPPQKPYVPPSTFGFVDNAETWNSRAAMIGFFSLILVEAITNKGLLELMGVTVGKGLNIGF